MTMVTYMYFMDDNHVPPSDTQNTKMNALVDTFFTTLY